MQPGFEPEFKVFVAEDFPPNNDTVDQLPLKSLLSAVAAEVSP